MIISSRPRTQGPYQLQDMQLASFLPASAALAQMLVSLIATHAPVLQIPVPFRSHKGEESPCFDFRVPGKRATA